MEENKLALKSAINLLNRRWYSISGIREKLVNRKFSSEDIDKAIAFLIDQNYLNDIRFAKLFIKDHQTLRHEGKIIINQKLYKKGISKVDIAQAWQQYEDEYGNNEHTSLTELIAQKLKKFQVSNYRSLDQSQKQRLLASLIRKGFSYSQIKSALALLGNEE